MTAFRSTAPIQCKCRREIATLSVHKKPLAAGLQQRTTLELKLDEAKVMYEKITVAWPNYFNFLISYRKIRGIWKTLPHLPGLIPNSCVSTNELYLLTIQMEIWVNFQENPSKKRTATVSLLEMAANVRTAVGQDR